MSFTPTLNAIDTTLQISRIKLLLLKRMSAKLSIMMLLYFDLIFWEIRQMCENDRFRIHLLNCGTCKEKVV